MKKGLSVLLIAAALFGFYGGATNLNDVLACKDYFTSASGASDDMQRLEDGLNQLKDNEQAYLDGQVALAEGEKALADAEVQLADGEKQLADGRKALAEGEAAYKAAPAKLAAGEKQLAEGEESYDDLKSLISGLKEARDHGTKTTKKHDTYWNDGFTFDTYKENEKAGLKPGRKYIVQTLDGMPTEVATIESLAGLPSGTIAGLLPAEGGYKKFDDGAVKTVKILTPVKKVLSSFVKDAKNLYAKAAPVYAAVGKFQESHNPADLPSDDQLDALKAAAEKVSASQYDGINDLINKLTYSTLSGEPYNTSYSEVLSNTKSGAWEAYKAGFPSTIPQYAGAVGGCSGVLANVMNPEGNVVPTLNGYIGKLKKVIDTLNAWDEGYDTLHEGKLTLGSRSKGIPYAFKNMTSNKTIKAAIKKYDKGLMKELKKYNGNRLNDDGMQKFDDDLVYISEKIIPRALKVLAHVKTDAEKQLKDGKAQLNKGYKDYKEAPGKLADGRRQLAEGEAQLADGYAQYEDGKKQLEDGKAQLAQYEDGEQQVRDGLATLVGTDAMGNVQSIADRIGNDTDFDNGDKHLELDEGLSAVQAGKGYAADLTAAVTDEIMGRAVGTGLLIGAGVLAVLAALLSFLKKNKGAGVFAILAAAAGCVGAVMGNNAGMQFSSIAGSTMGATPWVAAGILAAVAAVHAVVHFAAKKAA